MIDFHSHILPKIDDGSKSVKESLQMIEMLSNQGVTTAIATPHFYANSNSVNDFLMKRQASFEKLLPGLGNQFPKIVLGAEVKYYDGISRLEGLSQLRISDTKLLLLEMPMKKWTEYTLRELTELSGFGDFIIVLAHIERYLKFQNKEHIEFLRNHGILMQANADFFISLATRRKAINMLRNNYIHFIGSDCHNIAHRPPRICEALDIIRHKVGDNFVAKMNDFAYSFFQQS